MGRIRVAVVYGGRSSEHGVSVVSAGSVLRAFDPDRYDVVPVGITRGGQWLLTDAKPEQLRITGRTLPEVDAGTAVSLSTDPAAHTFVSAEPGAALEVLASVDVVFPVLHGRFGEDGTIQGLLDLAGVPYVGPGVLASAAAMDKEFTKRLLRDAGLAVGRFAVLRRGRPYAAVDLYDLGLPVFVKPARSGSSVGISKVRDWSDLAAAVDLAFEHDHKAIVEAAIAGREIECGVLEDPDGLPEASVPAEIRLRPGHDWYDFDAKYLDDACDFDVPADLPPEVTEEVRVTACRAFAALDCSGLARVDFFVTGSGQVVVNEVNTMPGFTPISMYPRMWAASGVDYPTLVDRLVQAALRREARLMGDTIPFGTLVSLMVLGTGEPDSVRGEVTVHQPEVDSVDYGFRIFRQGALARRESLDGDVQFVDGAETRWLRFQNETEFTAYPRGTSSFASPLGGLDVGGERPSFSRWDGTDFTRPTGPVREADFLGRPAWEVELAPPAHKPYPMQLVVDSATGLVLSAANRDTGFHSAWTALEVGIDLPDELFVWDGPSHPPPDRSDRDAALRAEIAARQAWLEAHGVTADVIPVQPRLQLHEWDDDSGALHLSFEATIEGSVLRRPLAPDADWPGADRLAWSHTYRWADERWEWCVGSDTELTPRQLEFAKDRMSRST